MQLVAERQTAAIERLNQPGREYTFNDISELCSFIQHEILGSRRKYSELADKAGVCASTVSNMAHGETHYPRAGTVFSILRVLGFEVVVRS